MTGKQFREDATPRPLEMAAVVACVVTFVLLLPVQGKDLAARILCFALGAGSLAIFNEYRRRALAKKFSTLSADLTPRCGVPMIGGAFCTEPATPGCCYCDLHAGWPNDRWSKKP